MKNELRQSMDFPKSFVRSSFGRVVLLILLSICSYLFFSRLVVSAVEVKGSSMSPTLISGDRVFLNRFAYLHREPLRGELVVLRDPETSDLVVKRIVGLPGDMVQVTSVQAFINGKSLKEPYIRYSGKAQLVGPRSAPVLVPKGSYYVLGDNRMDSVDSRMFGTVTRDRILGVINL
jgi:signal peptidase I